MSDELGPAGRDERNPVEVHTEDGTTIRCWTRAVPGNAMIKIGRRAKDSKVRWVFEAVGRQSIGPVADPDSTIGQLHAIVDAWWQRERRDRAEEKPVADAERPRTPRDTPAVIVTGDGSVFHCTRVGFPRRANSEMLAEARWVFTDANGFNHIGPSASAQCSREDLRGIVEDWWLRKCGCRAMSEEID